MTATNGVLTIEKIYDNTKSPPAYVFSLLNSTQGSVSFSCAITSPSAGASVSQGVPVTITGTISQAGTVVVKLGSTTLGSATMAGLSWSYSWTPQSGDAGAQTINAVATATADSSIANAPGIAITVSVMVCAITAPTAGATVTQGTVVSITGTISQAGTVAVKLGATLLGAATMAGLNWSYAWTPQIADIGAETLNATATATVGGAIGNAPGISITVAAAVTDPSTMPNLSGWLDGRAAAFSDAAGTVAATPNAGRVRRSNQPSPLSGFWDSAGSSPFREVNSVAWIPGAIMYESVTGLTAVKNATTMALSFRNRGNCISRNDLLGDNGNSWGAFMTGVGSTLQISGAGSTWNTGLNIPVNTPVALVIRWAAGLKDLSYNIGGTTGTLSQAGTFTGGSTSFTYMGVGSSEFANLVIAQAAMVNRVVTDTEMASLLAWCVANPAPSFPTDQPLIVVAGDSIPAGTNITYSSTAWPPLLMPNLFSTAAARLYNNAVSGYTIAQMATDYPTLVRPQLSVSRSKNILIVAGGTNSIAFGGLTGAQALTAYLAYCDTARTDGWKVIASPILPRSGIGTPGTFNADRATFNSGLATSGSHYDALADINTISGMGADGDSDSTVNFQTDKIHPNTTGHAKLEVVYRARVLAMIP